MRGGWFLVGSSLLLGCGSPQQSPISGPSSTASAAPSAERRPVPPAATLDRAAERAIGERFRQYLASYRDLTHDQLRSELQLGEPVDPPLGFDPTKARYYDEVAAQLQLTEQERGIFARRGVVGVDHGQRYSMGSAYFSIYARDLPVLITTDSILHALHRSYDQILQQLEANLLAAGVGDVLDRAHEELGRQARALRGRAPLGDSLRDVDLYLTVARNLLRGAGSSQREKPQYGDPTDVWDGKLVVRSRLGQDKAALALLTLISSLTLQDPKIETTSLYGGRRAVDYSQFAPRGHYTRSTALKRYFRALMWLGRADLGFTLAQPDPVSQLSIDGERETRDALVLAQLIAQSGGLPSLKNSSDVIDFMIGRSDSLGVAEILDASGRAGVRKLADLADAARVAGIRRDLIQSGAARQQIRSQALGSSRGGTKRTEPPPVFQVFGQRFVLDSFVLAEVVFDSIVFQNEKRERMLPQGLDVMAALGNDEAVRLLAPELERHQYAANLLAVRRVVDELAPAAWQGNLYNGWLGALRTLDDRPAAGPHFPRAMQGEAWQRKQLQAQLGSWAELRHDTVLYAKQSFTGSPMCGYPAAFVEPYPEFFAALGRFGRRAAELLGAAKVTHPDWRAEHHVGRLLQNQAGYFETFAGVMQMLERLAAKELRAEPFTDEETSFLKRTIDIRGMGSGPPRYDGWYPALLYVDGPALWEPVVADVHTDPDGQRALEVAVGDVNFVVVAVDNEDDRAVYVGPTYSYYEFTVPAQKRLTDEAWQERLETGQPPPRPAWAGSFQAKPVSRRLGHVAPAPAAAGKKPVPPATITTDAALTALLARIANPTAAYKRSKMILSDLSGLARPHMQPPGPRPPEPTSAAPFDNAAFAAASEAVLRRIGGKCGPREVVPRGRNPRFDTPSWVALTLSSEGRVIESRLMPEELAATAYGRCVRAAFGNLRVPAFNELFQARTVNLPMKRP